MQWEGVCGKDYQDGRTNSLKGGRGKGEGGKELEKCTLLVCDP